jgi:DNA-binding PadR family transcriptional regulator
MLELSALGLLKTQPLHGYLLKKRLELFMGSCMTVNYGAIYPLLKRLEEQGYILALDSTEGNKKIFQITPKGSDRWRQKMLEEPQESWVKSRARFLIKFFFFSQLAPEERIQLINHRLRACQLRKEELEDHKEKKIDDHYQFLAWQRAENTLQDEILWLEEQLRYEKLALKSWQTEEISLLSL